MFCKVCGNELNDAAVICPKCGCAVEGVSLYKKKKKEKATIDGQGTTAEYKVMNYISIGFICLSIMFFAISIVTGIAHDYISEYDLQYTSINIRASIWLGECAIPCFISSVLAYGCATTSFILSFKGENNKSRFTADVLFIIVNCLLPVGICALCRLW